jgi:hypothetical protein
MKAFCTLIAAALLLVSSTGLAARAAQNVNPQAAALVDFQNRLQQYLRLRAQLAQKLKPLSPTPSAADLAARQESLAAALRDVRKDARHGDLVSPVVAEQIRKAVDAYFRGKDQSTRRAVFEDVPENVRPVVNRTVPDGAALATVPPLLLNSLPHLPEGLQYRFVGRHIMLVDADTRLIMDYIQNALPPH